MVGQLIISTCDLELLEFLSCIYKAVSIWVSWHSERMSLDVLHSIGVCEWGPSLASFFFVGEPIHCRYLMGDESVIQVYKILQSQIASILFSL